MGNVPPWLVAFVVQWLEKFITPERVAALEAWAVQLVCCKLKVLAASTASPIDDELVQKVADALGADLSKCPA